MSPDNTPDIGGITPEQIAEAIGSTRPTAEQAAVIAGAPEPTLVVAGAGAGKTETMAARVVYLVASGHSRPSQVLGLTFTRKAAQQLAQRVQKRLDAFAASEKCRSLGERGREIAEAIRTEQPRIGTYDSFAGDLLASHGLLVPVEPDARLISETDLYILTHSLVSEWDHALPWSAGATTGMVIALAEQISSHLSSTAELRAHPNILEEFYQGTEGTLSNDTLRDSAAAQENRHELLDLVDALHARLAAEGALTFGMRMAHAARLARDVPEVAAAERRLVSAVLLDEYQDTGQSQRIMLASLFGGSDGSPLAVTAVGDPMQSIYGWRGASASNLDSFLTDFPRPGGPAEQSALSMSWRNPPEVLGLANGVTSELRGNAGDAVVPVLESRAGATPGYVRAGLFLTVDEEREWIAEHVEDRYRRLESEGGTVPKAAVLVRRNADAEPLAKALRARGLEVEVLSSGGLLSVPEIADLLALVRVAVDPGDDAAAIRLLTGDRFRLGAADLEALSSRARTLSLDTRDGDADAGASAGLSAEAALRARFEEFSELENIDAAGLADAAVNPGTDRAFSDAGREAIAAFLASVRSVRERLDQGPAHVVSIAESVLGLDVEVRVRALLGDGEGRRQLDALSRVAADFAAHPDASVAAFLDYLDVAQSVERGLAQDVVPREGCVQILTVHSAKGLEWDIVAVPHVCRDRFTKIKSPSTWVKTAAELPVEFRGDVRTPENPGGIPALDLEEVEDYKQLSKALQAHIKDIGSTVREEDRRLFYVAVTRTESDLLVSGFQWTPGRKTVLGPATFLSEVRELIADSPSLGIVEEWADDAGPENPLAGDSESAPWPVENPGEGASSHAAIRTAAGLVDRAPAPENAGHDETIAAAVAAAGPEYTDPVAAAWLEEALIHVSRAGDSTSDVIEVEVPHRLTATQHVALERDPASFAVDVLRPMPRKPNQFARRGTSFHAWVERYYTEATQFLLDDEDLPGSGDEGWEARSGDELREAFLSSAWADRQAVAVEVPFTVSIGGHIKVGTMDAVFRDEDGWTVVDWKTGAKPGGKNPDSAESRKHRDDVAIQLAIYRLAWARILERRTGEPVDPGTIRGAFHYIGSGEDVYPEHLPSEAELAERFDRRFAAEIGPDQLSEVLGYGEEQA